jgi:hypothetical protein
MIPNYLRALWSHWSKLLTGGSIIALAAIWQYTGNSIWPIVGAGIVTATFLTASFRAWKQERADADDLRSANETLDAGLRDSLTTYVEDLAIGPLSILPPIEQCNEARRQFVATAQAAENGDVRAQGRLRQRAETLHCGGSALRNGCSI